MLIPLTETQADRVPMPRTDSRKRAYSFKAHSWMHLWNQKNSTVTHKAGKRAELSREIKDIILQMLNIYIYYFSSSTAIYITTLIWAALECWRLTSTKNWADHLFLDTLCLFLNNRKFWLVLLFEKIGHILPYFIITSWIFYWTSFWILKNRLKVYFNNFLHGKLGHP